MSLTDEQSFVHLWWANGGRAANSSNADAPHGSACCLLRLRSPAVPAVAGTYGFRNTRIWKTGAVYTRIYSVYTIQLYIHIIQPVKPLQWYPVRM